MSFFLLAAASMILLGVLTSASVIWSKWGAHDARPSFS